MLVRMEANALGRWGGIFNASRRSSFVSTNNFQVRSRVTWAHGQTDFLLQTQFDTYV